jgi:hypothetical protein
VTITSNAGSIALELEVLGLRAGLRARPLVQHYGSRLLTMVRANASGRPGPRVQTGDYRRSINLDIAGVRGSVSATVGTNRPQGRRLEFGFNGTDSAGRSYNQPPLPHFGPAAAAIEPEFVAAVQALMQ